MDNSEKDKYNFWNEIKIAFSNIFWNRYFLFLVGSIILFQLSLLIDSKVGKILSMLLLIVAYGFYTFNISINQETKLFSKGVYYILMLLLSLFWIAYLAAQVGEKKIAIISIVLIEIIVLISLIVTTFIDLFFKETSKKTIVSYLFFSISIILLFSIIFTIFNQNSSIILNVQNKSISTNLDYFIYTSSIYYSSNYPSYLVNNYDVEKVSLVLSFISVLIHVLGISTVYNSSKKGEN